MSKLMRQAVRMGSARANHTCTLIPGDGIGPEISESVQKIFQAAGVSRHILVKVFIFPPYIQKLKKTDLYQSELYLQLYSL